MLTLEQLQLLCERLENERFEVGVTPVTADLLLLAGEVKDCLQKMAEDSAELKEELLLSREQLSVTSGLLVKMLFQEVVPIKLTPEKKRVT